MGIEVIAILLAVGALLIGFEVFLPGGILGALGGLALLAAIGLAFSQYGPFGGLATGGLALLLVVGVIVFELKVLPHTAVGKKMFNTQAVTAKAVETGEATSPGLIGRHGVAATTFAPTGLAEIEGKRYEAASLDGLLSPGEPLVVTGRDNYKLLVKKAPAA